MACSPGRNGRCARPLNSVVRLHVGTSIAQIWGKAGLRVTVEARSELLRLIGEAPLSQPIACVSWVFDEMRSDGEKVLHRGPHWGLGFYSAEQVPPENVVEIEGIPFVFGADDAVRLNGATLDLVHGEFVVNERAI